MDRAMITRAIQAVMALRPSPLIGVLGLKDFFGQQLHDEVLEEYYAN